MSQNTPSHPPHHSLFLQHAATVRGFVFGLVMDRAAADDVFQEVFLTVVQRSGDFRPDGNFLAWVRGIARNKVLEYYRRQRLQSLPFDEELLELLVEATDEREPQWERRREALSRCLERLAPRAREIVDLRYAEQSLSPPEIAARLSWTTNAVHVALARARAFLRECVQQALATEAS